MFDYQILVVEEQEEQQEGQEEGEGEEEGCEGTRGTPHPAAGQFCDGGDAGLRG